VQRKDVKQAYEERHKVERKDYSGGLERWVMRQISQDRADDEEDDRDNVNHVPYVGNVVLKLFQSGGWRVCHHLDKARLFLGYHDDNK